MFNIDKSYKTLSPQAHRREEGGELEFPYPPYYPPFTVSCQIGTRIKPTLFYRPYSPNLADPLERQVYFFFSRPLEKSELEKMTDYLGRDRTRLNNVVAFEYTARLNFFDEGQQCVENEKLVFYGGRRKTEAAIALVGYPITADRLKSFEDTKWKRKEINFAYDEPTGLYEYGTIGGMVAHLQGLIGAMKIR